MRFIADLHIHSKYSRATSRDMDIENLNKWAKIKGVKVLGTGDFTHPLWLKELKQKLEPAEPGLFKMKKKSRSSLVSNDWLPNTNNHQDEGIRFLLSSEISCIYSKNNRTRKIHIVVLAPDFSVVEKINTRLGWIGNLKADGRPILGLDAKELAKIVLNTSEDCLIIPGHIWTPWFSLFGSNSGFDSLRECFDEYSQYIYAGETGLSCYDEETEVLTNDGWKKFPRLRKADKICTLNSKTDKIEFQSPKRIFTYEYKGKMYRLKTKRVDLLVTPNHNLLVSGCDFRKPPRFFLKKAEFLFNKSKRFKKNGIWNGKDIKHFVLPAVKIRHGSNRYSGFRNKEAKRFPMKSWLKFFGFWIAEGWTTQGKEGDYNVCLSNKDAKLLSEMKQLLESFGYNVYRDDKINNTIRVRNYQLFHYLKQFGKCSDKFISSDIKLLSKELLEILLEYYIRGDGHIYGRTGRGLSATTTSVRLRDDLQEIALKTGISAYYKLDQKKGTPFRSPGQNYKKVYKQREDSWVIYFIRKNIHAVLPSTVKKYKYTESWVDFEGKVFSVAVPNKVIYVRRNGIPVWCGNSDPAMNWRWSALDRIALLSNSDAHSTSRIGREANIFDTELSYPAIVQAIKSKDPQRFLETIEFFPEEGRYHYDGHRNCQVRLAPQEAKKLKNICTQCGKPLTVGVLHRVDDLADRQEGDKPSQTIPFKKTVPLEEIIAEAKGMGVGSKAVREEYKGLIKRFGSEFKILFNVSPEQIEQASLPELAEGIKRVRQEKVQIEPGYDGEYGRIKIFKDEERGNFSKQASLF